MSPQGISSAVPIFRAAPEAEVIRGSVPYGEILSTIHKHLCPRVYVEIGVRHGYSLVLASAETIVGIDPLPELAVELPKQAHVVHSMSDAFFASSDCLQLISQPIDFAFIDGMHLFEFALRDFINVERRASEYGVVVLDDVFPNHPIQAKRERQSGVWTGDVWKILPCLSKYRQDLVLLTLDTSPSGLLIVTNLNPSNDDLSKNYDAIVAEFSRDLDVPASVLERRGVTSPSTPALVALFERLANERGVDEQGVADR
jgi:hypothetical protein